jgi:phosphoglycolate phosphatase
VLVEAINMTRLTLFDFDGVLADTRDDMLRLAAEAGASLGLHLHPTYADLEALDTMDLPSYGHQLGVPEDMLNLFADQVRASFVAQPGTAPIFPGMQAVLASLAGESLIAIITGNATRLVEDFLNHNGLQDAVSLIYAGDLPGTRLHKILRALRDAGVHSERACIVSDAVSDTALARQAGLRSIAVTWGYQSREKLASVQPDAIADTPRDLQAVLENIFQ